jgi:hypothetical protein
MSDHLTELHELAMAALYFPEIARGVEGDFDISTGEMTLDEYNRVKSEIREGQCLLYLAGWRQDKVMERSAPYDRIEVGVWKKRFDGKWRWIVCDIALYMGITATFKCSKKKPW